MAIPFHFDDDVLIEKTLRFDMATFARQLSCPREAGSPVMARKVERK
ncbi:hypothetical protein ACODT5_14645 [Streptomyces sp. 5.8]